MMIRSLANQIQSAFLAKSQQGPIIELRHSAAFALLHRPESIFLVASIHFPTVRE